MMGVLIPRTTWLYLRRSVNESEMVKAVWRAVGRVYKEKKAVGRVRC
jgi:hypothetical protein